MPTNHPCYKNDRRPLVNVFSLMPVTNAGEITSGATLGVNVAQYVDPTAEMDYQRLVTMRPRWMQGLLLRVNAVQGVFTDQIDNRSRVYPADRVFTGDILNRSTALPVVGVMHPG